MLSKLTVQNYALIDEIEIDFSSGFNVITGETGSGKSLLLGALGLLLGQQADFSKLRNKNLKCISEGVFNLRKLNLNKFFSENDIDFEHDTIIRRELSPSGKSRAFINDTPVNLSILKEFCFQLIDIHSQNETGKIQEKGFLYDVLDAFAAAEDQRKVFAIKLKNWKSLKSELLDLQSKESQLKTDREYYAFQVNELSEIDLTSVNLGDLESELKMLNNSEEVKEKVFIAEQHLSAEQGGILVNLKNALQSLNSINDPDSELSELILKIEAIYPELDDLAFEIRKKYDKVNPDEQRLNELTELVNSLNTFLLKHRARNVDELLEKKLRYESLLEKADSFDFEISELNKKIQISKAELLKTGHELTFKRSKIIPELEKFINGGLAELGMADAEFKVSIDPIEDFNQFGVDKISFLIKSNKGSEFSELHKVASGGEMSRIMFLIKSSLASKKQIATLVLDEIDTGISGEVASKLANRIRKMGSNTQIIAVSHLAQMASKAHSHFKISKKSLEESTATVIKSLDSKQDKIEELASILSGDEITQAALKNAESLLLED